MWWIVCVYVWFVGVVWWCWHNRGGKHLQKNCSPKLVQRNRIPPIERDNVTEWTVYYSLKTGTKEVCGWLVDYCMCCSIGSYRVCFNPLLCFVKLPTSHKSFQLSLSNISEGVTISLFVCVFVQFFNHIPNNVCWYKWKEITHNMICVCVSMCRCVIKINQRDRGYRTLIGIFVPTHFHQLCK
jgi:hypothetical protein